ncbi:Hypothetical protein SCV20265_4197 [Pseudomonas aeruginosa SCV20265]|nr:Hypothetical protein SCV20265_4197 [Pseudomonas aeruginosa SCV20265]AWZ88408.1 hypothetical protein CSC41_5464 [Pseudomonas aeruginosa]
MGSPFGGHAPACVERIHGSASSKYFLSGGIGVDCLKKCYG